MGFIRRFVIGLIVIVILVILGLGYLGFVPGVSKILGADEPRDLGVTYTDADLKSMTSKNHVQRVVVESAPDIKSSFVLKGTQAIKNVFTDTEITARLSQESDWSLNPFTDVQVKIGQDGTVEASGVVRVDRLKGYAEATGMSPQEIEVISKVMDKYKVPKTSFPAYVKGNLTIENNKLDIDLSELYIGKIPVAKALYSQAKIVFEGLVDERLTSGGYGSLDVKSLSFSNGKMNFSGNIPKVITTARTVLSDQ
ncbi:hypothetical protein [Candidatus Cryosericum terrychapinii]|jgi:hypothetical protein|uniref:Uncharacterized protein n=1 Tax=Candidatus Cryosericum terrychapinii TaxID=2290919 RepID=A0A398CV49_9BACT|nr:hypothetical protein [Candidatus Cryosericum terrychapinii]RIE06050.1 hypothetical protein SMC7_04470 [Candidatus Cryosericum terrychapinii]